MPVAGREPPYLRIASELRRRIREGTLRPGQRAPSTRRLAKTWKVAHATASKALATLVHEGLLRGVPRVGNVVTGPAPLREPRAAGGLGRAAIVSAAVQIADREGVAALSMRGVAARMECPVTSLYRHVPKKDDLLGLMVDAVMAEETHPAPEGGWRARVEEGARLVWRMARRHPWVTRVITLTRPLPSERSLAHAEWMLSALAETGAGAEAMMQMHVAIYGYIQGLAANLESEAQAEGETGVDEDTWMRSREPDFVALAATGAFPTFARVLTDLEDGFELDLDRVFEFGLARLLDGFASWTARPAR